MDTAVLRFFEALRCPLLDALFQAFSALGEETASAAARPALLVGLSRVYLGVHNPSDVLAGLALGLLAALAGQTVYARFFGGRLYVFAAAALLCIPLLFFERTATGSAVRLTALLARRGGGAAHGGHLRAPRRRGGVEGARPAPADNGRVCGRGVPACAPVPARGGAACSANTRRARSPPWGLRRFFLKNCACKRK